MAMVLGAALVLKSGEDKLQGTIKIVFQPSEEKRPGGARLLLPELLKDPVPQAIFGQHVFPNLPTGTVGIRPGAFFASSDNIIFSVEGKIVSSKPWPIWDLSPCVAWQHEYLYLPRKK